MAKAEVENHALIVVAVPKAEHGHSPEKRGHTPLELGGEVWNDDFGARVAILDGRNFSTLSVGL